MTREENCRKTKILLARFLKSNNIYHSFLANHYRQRRGSYFRKRDDIDRQIISLSFIWENTKEKHAFWHKVSLEYGKLFSRYIILDKPLTSDTCYKIEI